MATTHNPRHADVLTKLNVRYIDIFVRSVMSSPFIFSTADVSDKEMKEYIADTIKMVNDVINGGIPAPKRATEFQCRIIDELVNFHDNMSVLMNPFTYLTKPNTVETKSSF